MTELAHERREGGTCQVRDQSAKAEQPDEVEY